MTLDRLIVNDPLLTQFVAPNELPWQAIGDGTGRDTYLRSTDGTPPIQPVPS